MTVIVSIFAGRQRYLHILKKYLDELLKRNLIDEVHLWNYARNDEDYNYIVQLSNQNSKYKLFTPNKNDINKKNGQWNQYYAYYINSEYGNNDILIKCDDDIVFIDIDNFSRYINTVKDDTLCFPNIINNDVGAYIQTLHGVHNLLPEQTIQPHFKQFACDAPLTGWQGWFTKNHLADLIHTDFLNNPSRYSLEIPDIKWNSRISINMFAGNFKTIKKYFKLFTEVGLNTDDESFFSAHIIRLTHNLNTIIPYFNIAHFSFNPQLTKELDMKYLPLYNNLANKKLNISDENEYIIVFN